MAMQKDAVSTDYPVTVHGGASTVAPCPTGLGGNMTLINQNEAETTDASYECTQVTQIGYADNVSNVQGAFREQAL